MPFNDEPMFHNNEFSGVPDFGLSLDGPPSGPGIGLSPQPTPPVSPKESSLQNLNPLAKIGLMLQAFGAGGRGQTPMIMQLQKQELEKKKRRREEMAYRLEVTERLTKTARSLQGPEREKFLDSAIKQYAEDDQDFASFIRTSAQRPDILATLPKAAQTDPMLRSFVTAGDFEGANKYITSEQGQKNMSKAASAVYMQEFVKKADPLVKWYETNDRETIERIRKDGVTINELRELHDKAPLHLQLSPEAFANITAPENQERLVGSGLNILPDKVVAEIQREKLTEKGDPEFVKLQTERDRLMDERTNSQDPTAQARIDRKVSEINERLSNLQTAGKDPGEKRIQWINTFSDNYRQEVSPIKKLKQLTNTAKDLIAVSEQVRAEGGDVSAYDLAIRKTVLEMYDTGQVAATESKEWKNFGDLPTRLMGGLTGFFSGRYTDAQRGQLKTLVERMDAGVVSPAMRQIDDRFIKTLKPYEIEPHEIGIDVPTKPKEPKEEPKAEASGLPSPKTKEEYDKLPSGTRYMHPDGKERVKK